MQNDMGAMLLDAGMCDFFPLPFLIFFLLFLVFLMLENLSFSFSIYREMCGELFEV